MASERCKKCRSYVKIEKKCHFNPPVTRWPVIENKPWRGPAIFDWPSVPETGWCSQYKEKE